MSNSIDRVFVEKLGGTGITTTFVGNEGELFWDPATTTLKMSDGSTAGGVGIGGGGGGGNSSSITDGTKTLNFDSNNKLQLDTDFLPTVDSDGTTGFDLGASNAKWRDLYLSGSTLNLAGLAISVSNSQLVMPPMKLTGPLLPDTNSQYDLGSAEYKIRHLFLSDNSLWIGDNHKMDTKTGEVKFRKRKNNIVPSTVVAEGGDEAGALAATGAGSLSEITLSQWLAYLTSLDNTKTNIEDLYPAEGVGTGYTTGDYDSVANETPSHKLTTPTTSSATKDFYLDRGDRVAIHSVFPEMGGNLNINIHNAGGPAPYGGTFEVDIWIKSYQMGLPSGGIDSLTIDGTAVTPTIVGTFSNEISLYNIKGIQLDETSWKVVVTLS